MSAIIIPFAILRSLNIAPAITAASGIAWEKLA